MPRKAEHYSGANPVPKAATNLKSLWNPEHATEAKAQELQNQDGEMEQKETDKRASKMEKGRVMNVRDPTTGDEVEIKNADESHDDRTSGENILHIEFPPPDWSQHRQYMLSITTSSMISLVSIYTVSVFIIHSLPLPFVQRHSLLQAVVSLFAPSLAAYILLFRLRRAAQGDFEDRAWHSERVRGLRAGSDLDGDGEVKSEERTKESAEWANALLRGVWPIVNPQLFQSSVDLLEDIMQSSVPSFIHSVRVADIDQGSNPLRITAIRSLQDTDTNENMEQLEETEREQLDGDHVNLEIAFAYRAVPSGKSQSSKAQNAHLLIEFFMGIKGVWAFRIPVWVELKGVAGTARARLQLIPDPPFVKKTLVTLMGLPRISIKVTPTRMLPNMMSLPVVSQFISSSIDAATAQYVAPRSLTLDLQQLISGDDIKKDTTAIGVLVVQLHRATGIKKMDTRGSSDPYLTLTYSRLGKPMFSTRIIKDDLNPVFEETAILLVNLDNVKLKEQLSIQLWDSDRASADDMMGFVEEEIVDRLRNKNKPIRRIAPLQSPDGKARPGTVEFTVGYYAKMWPNSSLKTDGSDPGIPEDLREEPEFKEARATALNDLEAAVLVTPPDPDYPTGILSVEIHEMNDLSVRTDGKETKGKGGIKGQEEAGQEQEEGEGLPSPYCTISLNDELVYETRVKPLSSSPMMNAGTERLVRDWRNSHVTVTVKDSRVRENDAVLGIVLLKLSDLFVNASQVTRSYPVEKGGRIRISVLFRPVELKLPQTLLGFDTGTIEFRDVSVDTDSKDLSLSDCELLLHTSSSSEKEKIARKQAETDDAGRISWLGSQKIHLPVRQRYGSALFITFRSSGLTASAKRAFAVLWLRDLPDNEAVKLEIALWTAGDNGYSRLEQNYLPPDGDLRDWDSDKEKVTRVGTVRLDATFLPGVSDAHRKMLTGSDVKKRSVWEDFVREQAGGLRESVGVRENEEKRPDGQGVGSPREKNPTFDSGDEEDRQDERPGTAHSDNYSSPNPKLNSIVPQEEARVEDGAQESTQGEADEDGSGDDKGTLKERWHKWKEEEETLHRDHRGIMARKPARTAKWLKDNMEVAGHKIKDRFSQQEREPDVETEV